MPYLLYHKRKRMARPGQATVALLDLYMDGSGKYFSGLGSGTGTRACMHFLRLRVDSAAAGAAGSGRDSYGGGGGIYTYICAGRGAAGRHISRYGIVKKNGRVCTHCETE